MNTITSKAQLNPLVQKAIETFEQKDEDAFVKTVRQQILSVKIRFPLLEHAAFVFVRNIPAKQYYSVAEKIMHLDTIGGNVLVGILLQQQLEKDLVKAMKEANRHIVQGDLWYVCDIIGERVAGVALLTQPEKTIPLLKKMSKNENKWIVRTVGVATHYAVKKGLKKKYADEMFGLLMTLGNTTDFHTKKGIGWAAKTIAKFHPDIIQQHQKALSNPEIKTWFKTKIRIGLGRSEKYASRYKS
jgi:hypothetical protein